MPTLLHMPDKVILARNALPILLGMLTLFMRTPIPTDFGNTLRVLFVEMTCEVFAVSGPFEGTRRDLAFEREGVRFQVFFQLVRL